MENLLLLSENLHALQYLLEVENLANKVDLVYIDPPFATGMNFTITQGRATTISNSKTGDFAYKDTLKGDDVLTNRHWQ